MDFANSNSRLALKQTIVDEINNYSAAQRVNRRSVRLSPSTLGQECVAASFFSFRWCSPLETPDGRMSRYNARGEAEEENVLKLLRGTGWTVREYSQRLIYGEASDLYLLIDWNAPIPDMYIDVHDKPEHVFIAKTCGVKLEQLSVTDFNGHLYGKIDAEISHPVHTDGQFILFENKYINTKRFVTLTKKPLIEVDPKYYTQICLYMYYRNYPAAMFFTGNRNEDDIHPAIFPRDDVQVKLALERGQTILSSNVVPAKISQSESFYKCTFCDHKGVCHRNEQPVINCRSCVRCVPTDGGKFFCQKWQATIPNKEAILEACPQWESIV